MPNKATPAQWKRWVLQWYREYGRHDLPWQQNTTPYSCWLSEIMLQQTQVMTVIGYFERFMAAFPTVHALANAPLDDVLSLWSGLGYYARARNLHKAAQMVCEQWNGEFPSDPQLLLMLPGIGLSTANAIVAQAFHKPAAILDGNVKRVLSRFHGVSSPINQPKTVELLWDIAVTYLPESDAADYAQAMMDLGAVLCTRTKPACVRCPLSSHCEAYKSGEPERFPVQIKKPPKPTQSAHFALLIYRNTVCLRQRPPSGIWGGLWSLPEVEKGHPKPVLVQEGYRHSFTHFHLDYRVSLIKLTHKKTSPHPNDAWVSLEKALQLGLPAPIRRLLENYHEHRVLPEAQKRTARA